MRIALYLLILLSATVFMEFFAWFMHKYVMHGFLWSLHEDHHHPKKRGLEKNDLFTLFFASIAVFLCAFGGLRGIWPMLFAGLGVTLYGLGYFLFHDILFHRRLRFLKLKADTRYLRRIVNAHAVHHQKTKNRDNGISFGFLYAQSKYDVG